MSVPAIHTIDLPRPAYPFIPEHVPTDEPVSVHVLDAETTVLFGTGYATAAGTLLAALEDIGGIDVVVVEHGDVDHYDAVPILRQVYDDFTVAVPRGDAETIEVSADVMLNHDDRRWGVRSIHVPGHTPGNMSFLHEPTGTLFAGDSVVHAESANAAEGDWRGPLAPMKTAFNADDDAASANIERLADYTFNDIRITHGPNVSDGGAAIEQLLEDLEAHG